MKEIIIQFIILVFSASLIAILILLMVHLITSDDQDLQNSNAPWMVLIFGMIILCIVAVFIV